MATVPIYNANQATPTVAPTPQIGGPGAEAPAYAPRGEAPNLNPDAGKDMQRLGQGLQNTGSDFAAIAADMQARANTLRVDEAVNNAREAALRLAYDKDNGYTMLKGKNALQNPDDTPRDITEEYGNQLRTHISTIASTLGNDAQRQAFALHANDLLTTFQGGVIRHVSSEYQTHALSVADGVQATATREIALKYNQPEVIDAAIQRIEAETYRQAQLLGKSGEWQDAQARKLISNGLKLGMLAAIGQNDPATADAMLNKYKGRMDADDIWSVRAHITKEMDARIGTGAANDVMQKMQPRIQPSEVERAFNAGVIPTEGGVDRNGNPLTSPKGAVGIAQVMPDTAKYVVTKIWGKPWDAETEARYRTDMAFNKAIGLAYFQEQVQTYGGDLSKAYAAYNAGPGRVDKAVKAASLARNDPNFRGPLYDGKGDPLDWRSYLPAETSAYVVKASKGYDSGQGNPTRPTFQEIDDLLRQDPRLVNNPTRYKLAREEATRQFEEQTKAIKQREEDAVANAIRWGMQNGYRFSAMPASMVAAVPADKLDHVRNTMAEMSKGDKVDNPLAYQKVKSNPQMLAGMSESEWFNYSVANFSQETKKRLDDERAKLMGNAPTGSPGDLNMSAIKQELDQRLRMLGIDPTPKDDGGSDAARVGGIRRFVDSYFVGAQKEAGKKFTDADVAQHLDALFAKSATLRGWIFNSSGSMMSMKVGDLDSDTKRGIKEAFKRRGVDDPTDAQIMNAYWSMKIARK